MKISLLTDIQSKFDSKKEARRYQQLKLMEKAGEITGIKVHPKFPIMVNGEKICTYIADFEYWTKFKNVSKCPERVIEDVKGVKTAVYQLKKKLMFACHGISIVEI
jgi:hypothetical protein